MLRLEAETIPPLIDLAPFALDAAVEKVAGVELHARLRRVDFEDPPAHRLIDSGRQRGRAAAVQHKIVVVALAQEQLFILLLDPRADRRRLGKVHRRPFDAP